MKAPSLGRRAAGEEAALLPTPPLPAPASRRRWEEQLPLTGEAHQAGKNCCDGSAEKGSTYPSLHTGNVKAAILEEKVGVEGQGEQGGVQLGFTGGQGQVGRGGRQQHAAHGAGHGGGRGEGAGAVHV
jgi:hypothetical protein